MGQVVEHTVYTANGRNYGTYNDALVSLMPGLPDFIRSIYKTLNDNGRVAAKMTLIKTLRDAYRTVHGEGLGLLEAKHYIEACLVNEI